GAALAGKDGEAVDDDVERVARDGEAEMLFWGKSLKPPSTCTLFWGRCVVARMGMATSPSAALTSSVWFEGLLSSSRASGSSCVVVMPSARASVKAALS